MAVFSLSYLNNVIGTHYGNPESKRLIESNLTDELIRENQVIFQLFDEQRISQLAEVVISKYFILTEDELSLWKSDPEQYLDESRNDSDYIQILTSAEALFCCCLSKFDEPLALFVVKLLNSVAYGFFLFQFFYHIFLIKIKFKVEGENLQRLLLRDACYFALGLCYDHLLADITFETWLNTYFLPDLSHKNKDL